MNEDQQNLAPWELRKLQQAQQVKQDNPQQNGDQSNLAPWEQRKLAAANEVQPQQQEQPKQNTFMDAVEGFNRQFARIAEGGLQLGAQALDAVGIDTSGFQQKLAKVHAQHEADLAAAKQNSPIATTAGSIVGGLGAAGYMGGLTGGGLLSTAGGLAANAGRAGLLAGIMGGSEYVNPGESRIDNALNSAAVGTLAGGVGYGIGKGIQSGVSSLFKQPVQQAADDASKLGAITLGQATANPTIQGAEAALSKIPIIGGKGNIKNAANALQTEAKSQLSDMGVGLDSKASLADKVAQSFNKSYSQASQLTDDAYRKAFTLGEQEGIQIPLSNTNKAAIAGLDEFQSLANSGISTADLSHSTSGKILQDLATVDNLSPKNFESLRKMLSYQIGDLSRSGQDSMILPALKNAKQAMDIDLEGIAKSSSGEFGQAIKSARNLYQQLKVPFKTDPVLKKAVKEGVDPDALLNAAIKNERPHMTMTIMKNLDTEGKKTFSTAILQKAVEQVTDKHQTIDMVGLSKQFHKLGSTLNALPDTLQKQVKGLQTLLLKGDTVLKAAEESTGWGKAISYAGLAAMGAGANSVGGMSALVAALGGAKGLSSLMTNPRIVKSLIRLGGGKIAAKEANGIMGSIFQYLGKAIDVGYSAAKTAVAPAIGQAVGTQ